VQQLGDVIATMKGALTNLATCIEGDSLLKAAPSNITRHPIPHEAVGAWHDVEQADFRDALPRACSWQHSRHRPEVAYQERLAQLEEERIQLRRREEELKALSVDDVDLENVVKQLRARVGELEAREAKVSRLRVECGNLRTRIAELVAATIDHKALEDENARLLAQAAELHQVPAVVVASRRCHQDSDAE
jgi:response regulator RpfG family c-di-GMP phosphodiesterase